MVTINITDRVSEELKRLNEKVVKLNPVIGRSAANRVQSHLFEQNKLKPNKLGGSRTNFYSAAAKSTHFVIIPDGVLVVVAKQGIAQRYYGGVIRANKQKFLTIPACSEAYGKRAKEFKNLHVEKTEAGLALVENYSTKIRIGKKIKSLGETGGRVMFWLRKSVKQEGDESILPSRDNMIAAIIDTVKNYIGRNK